MRIFVAIDFESIQEYLSELIKEIDISGINFVSSYHLTLKFLGDVKFKKIEDIKKKLKEVKFSSFEITLDGWGVFPDEKKPRVVWIGLKEEDKLIELNAKINDKLGSEFLDDYSYKPHLTIGRVKGVDSKLFDQINKVKIESKKVKVDSFILYESVLDNPVVYNVLEKFESNYNNKK
tara:strand:+ start:245 stop:775 length:531 start_codon:yes stop_codon:yes gene_type:complete